MAQGGCTGHGQGPKSTAMNDWRRAIKNLYRKWDCRTYCVPPVYFKNVTYDTQTVAGLRVLVQQPLPVCSASTIHTASTSQLVTSSQSTPSSQPPSSSKPPSSSQSAQSSQLPPRSQPVSSSHSTPCSQPPSSSQPAPLNQPPSSSQFTSLALRSFSGDPAKVQESDSRDDFSQQHVMFNLQALGKRQKEPMFIVSQLNFADYLSKPAYAQEAVYFPRPVDLPRRDRKGDFDFLLPHLRSGILIGEMKSVGLNMPQSDNIVAKKVAQAAGQLDKSGRVVRHIVKDFAPGVRIVKTIFLPYVTCQQLRRVLAADGALERAVCATLDVSPPDVTTAVGLCLCADQLSDKATPHDVTAQTLTQLSGWFTRRMSAAVDPNMTRDIYLDVLARLVGPASTVSIHCVTPPRVEVRTLGEAVSELGERLAQVVLTLAQLSLLNRVDSLPKTCLVGPPGTGKTLMLALAGLHWLRQGHDVIVLSTWNASHAVSQLIRHQLEMTLREDPTPSAGTARFCHFNLKGDKVDVEAVIQSLVDKAKGQTLHILMDEAGFRARPILHRLLGGLSARLTDLHVWTASMYSVNIPPGLHVEPLTVPLRSAPAILREIGPVVDGHSDLSGYTDSGVASPSDGPTVIRLRHEGAQHAVHWPVHCIQCGQEVADVLKHQLHVGIAGLGSQNPTSGGTTASPPPLQYRDVLVLTRNTDFTDEVLDDKGDVVTSASGFVAGLRYAGIPVAAVSPDVDFTKVERGLNDLAMAQTDQVTVIHWTATHGLERKVVVYLPGRWQGRDDDKSEEQLEKCDRLVAVSRCSSQLVWVSMPRTNAPPTSSNHANSAPPAKKAKLCPGNPQANAPSPQAASADVAAAADITMRLYQLKDDKSVTDKQSDANDEKN